MYRIGMVAGESSGDKLGAGLIKSLTGKIPGIEVTGIGGPLMVAAGCEILYPTKKLSVMGLVEVLGKYREISRIRTDITRYFLENPPDVFIGIDAPDFNIDMEVKLKSHGIKTIHYVSPQVWAWREYRVKKIARAVDKVLVLLPFEKAFYAKHGIDADYTGHPAADTIKDSPDTRAARERLGIEPGRKMVAVMPGSRKMELDMLIDRFLASCAWCYERDNQLQFATSLLDEEAVAMVQDRLKNKEYSHLPLSVYINRSADVLEACDVALLASGTITLEAMLHKKPMVVAYRVRPLTYKLLKLFVKVNYVSLPNILANEAVVPECLQEDCVPDKMGPLLLSCLSAPRKFDETLEKFNKLHRVLKQGADSMAADSVIHLIQNT